MALILAFASFLHPFHLSAQECTPDTTASLKHFKMAYDAIFYHQGFAWGRSAYTGDGQPRAALSILKRS